MQIFVDVETLLGLEVWDDDRAPLGQSEFGDGAFERPARPDRERARALARECEDTQRLAALFAEREGRAVKGNERAHLIGRKLEDLFDCAAVLTAATMRLTVSSCSFASEKYSTSARSRSNSESDEGCPLASVIRAAQLLIYFPFLCRSTMRRGVAKKSNSSRRRFCRKRSNEKCMPGLPPAVKTMNVGGRMPACVTY
jgi:hypothetical protein